MANTMSDNKPGTTAVGVTAGYDCVSREEHERMLAEAYDNGYNAGRADAYMNDAYAVEEEIWPDIDETANAFTD